jgi:hypothetical protein
VPEPDLYDDDVAIVAGISGAPAVEVTFLETLDLCSS